MSDCPREKNEQTKMAKIKCLCRREMASILHLKCELQKTVENYLNYWCSGGVWDVIQAQKERFVISEGYLLSVQELGSRVREGLTMVRSFHVWISHVQVNLSGSTYKESYRQQLWDNLTLSFPNSVCSTNNNSIILARLLSQILFIILVSFLLTSLKNWTVLNTIHRPSPLRL